MGSRIVMAGGGTAGHVNPLLATAIALRDFGCDIVTVGCPGGIENTLVPQHGFDLVHIPKTDLPRRVNKGLFTFPFRMRQAKQTLRELLADADAVVGFGGYVSAPVYSVAREMGIPIIVHEQNVRPGWANKLGARHAKVVATTFSSTPLQAAHGDTVLTGLPLRPAIARLAAQRAGADSGEARRQACQRLGLNPAEKVLLITGGSLGAVHINEVMASVAAELPARVQVLHLTGKGKAQEVRAAVEAAGVAQHWHIHEYMTAMEDAFAVANLVITRSGAGMVAELTALGLPTVYVPLPIGNGEQMLNAADHVEAGGALIVKDSDFTAQWVQDHVYPMLDGHDGGVALRGMETKPEGLGRAYAAVALATLVMDCVREKHRGE